MTAGRTTRNEITTIRSTPESREENAPDMSKDIRKNEDYAKSKEAEAERKPVRGHFDGIVSRVVIDACPLACS